jgi:hypothetical protein
MNFFPSWDIGRRGTLYLIRVFLGVCGEGHGVWTPDSAFCAKHEGRLRHGWLFFVLTLAQILRAKMK